jgi:hypothetical protein
MGNGSDNRSITGFGFQPDFALTQFPTLGVAAALRFKDQAGDSSFLIDATGANTNRIQAFETDGFQVGTNTAVNFNANTFFSFGFKEGNSVVGGGGLAGGGTKLIDGQLTNARLVAA